MKKSLKSQAYFEIKSRILSCEFPPGMLLNETILCDMFSISRTPVRDALSRLEQEHLIHIFPPKGFIITAVTLEDVSNYFEVLLHTEPQTLLAHGKNIPFEELISINAFFTQKFSSATISEFGKALETFHNLIAVSCENPYFANLYKQLQNLEHRLFMLLPIAKDQLIPLAEQYHILIQECMSGNWEKASIRCRETLRVYQRIVTNSILITQSAEYTGKGVSNEKE